MNIRRGMFRFWVLFCVSWLLGCGMWAYSELTSPWLSPLAFVLPNDKDPLYQLDDPYSTFDLKPRHTEIELAYRVLLLVHPSVPQDIATSRARALMVSQTPLRETELRQKRLNFIPIAIGTALGVPLAMLAIGSALAWALSGFKKT